MIKLNLFSMVAFSLYSSIIFGIDTSIKLPDSIAPELKQIEALPRRTKPAELNIEVTKLKTESLEEVYIDRKTKNIYVDFSKKKSATLNEFSKKYNLIVTDGIANLNQINSSLKNSLQTINYEFVNIKDNKMLKIPYENESSNLYISVFENKNIIKIYSLDTANYKELNIAPTNFQTGITITDETGNPIQSLFVDHKYLAKGLLTKDSIITKEFKVIRRDGGGNIMNLSPTADTYGYELFINLDKGTSTLSKVGDEVTIKSNLLLEGVPGSRPIIKVDKISYRAPLTGSANPVAPNADKEHRGRVTSVISKSELNDQPNLKDGTYTSMDTILTVTFRKIN